MKPSKNLLHDADILHWREYADQNSQEDNSILRDIDEERVGNHIFRRLHMKYLFYKL